VAHIGGFVFGLVFAGVLIVTGLDRRLDAAQEKKITTEQDARILHAGRLIDDGRVAEAIAALEAYLARTPTSIDGHLELLRAASSMSDRNRMAIAYGRLIDLYMRARTLDAAADLHTEAADLGLATAIPMRTRAELANRLLSSNMTDPALRVYRSIL